MARRDFGSLRRLESGRWQARYTDADGNKHSRSFATKSEASQHLASVRSAMADGRWTSPRAGQQTLAAYSRTWLATRRVRGRPLSPRTTERYRSILDTHILPALGDMALRDLTPTRVRAWYAATAERPDLSSATTAKVYRLLHAILATAVADQELPRSPCQIPGAAAEHSAERPIATIADVYALADTVGDRWRALILLATFAGLRFGELAGLTRADVDLDERIVVVRRDLDELDSGRLQPGNVKSAASRRTVSLPAAIMPELEHHLRSYAAPGLSGGIFVGPAGGRLRRSNFRSQIWRPAVSQLGLEHLHFHDLRHTGNTLAAATGASTRELMARMGHGSSRAALIYQHATRDRDVAIAAALSDLITGARRSSRPAVIHLFAHPRTSSAEPA